MVRQTIRQEDIMPVLSSFYARVRLDPELGPIFNSIVEDWAEHLQRLEDFWSSLMLASGRYKGNPVAMHVIHANRIQPYMFARWLQLWEQTTSEMMSADIAQDIQVKAARIADRLNKAMHGPESVVVARRPSSTELAEPYRRTRIFDQETVPPALLNQHKTKDGTWAVVRIMEGQIVLRFEGNAIPPTVLEPKTPGFIEPCHPHRLELHGHVRFQLEFFDRDPRSNLTMNEQGGLHAYSPK